MTLLFGMLLKVYYLIWLIIVLNIQTIWIVILLFTWLGDADFGFLNNDPFVLKLETSQETSAIDWLVLTNGKSDLESSYWYYIFKFYFTFCLNWVVVHIYQCIERMRSWKVRNHCLLQSSPSIIAYMCY